MSLTSPTHDTTTLGKPLTSEDQLEKRRKNDEYSREKRFKDFILWMAIIFIVFITGAFMIDYVLNEDSRKFVLGLIQQNAIGIVFFVLYILGLNIQSRK